LKCLVLGGTGFIGTWLVNVLVRSGRDVVVVGTRSAALVSLPPKVKYISIGRDGTDAYTKELITTHEVYDLSHVRPSDVRGQDSSHEVANNLTRHVNLFERLIKTNVRRVLIVSSGGAVYGPQQTLPIPECACTAPISAYGKTKFEVEKKALFFFDRFGLPVIIARPSNAYGAGQQPFTGQGFIATAIGKILNDEAVTIFGAQGTIRDYIHVSDVAKGLVAVMDRGAPGQAYNIGTGIGLSNLDVVSALEPLAAANGKKVCVQAEGAQPFDVPTNVLDCSRLAQCSTWRPLVSFSAGIADAWTYVASKLAS
jgi:UDP-glucose 4-epimerase